MTYSIIGILAAIILLISNRDILWHKGELPGTQYVISYLGGRSGFEKILFHTGRIFFGFEITVILINFFYPLMPFYAMGYMLGTCVLHSFVMEDEKEEYRRELESAIGRRWRN